MFVMKHIATFSCIKVTKSIYAYAERQGVKEQTHGNYHPSIINIQPSVSAIIIMLSNLVMSN